MKISKTIHITATIALLAAAQTTAAEEPTEDPFGIKIGQSEESINQSFSKLIDYQDKNTIYFKKFPKPYRDFDVNFVVISKTHGVCLISSAKDGLSNINQSSDILHLFSEIGDDISAKYGHPKTTKKDFDNNTKLIVIKTKEKGLRKEWTPTLITISKIIFSISFNSTTSRDGIASISYIGKNYEQCKREAQLNRSANL